MSINVNEMILKLLMEEIVLRLSNSMGNETETRKLLNEYCKVKNFVDNNKTKGHKKLIETVSNTLRTEYGVFDKVGKGNDVYLLNTRKQQLDFLLEYYSKEYSLDFYRKIHIFYDSEEFGRDNWIDEKSIDFNKKENFMVTGTIDIDAMFEINFRIECQEKKEKDKIRYSIKRLNFLTIEDYDNKKYMKLPKSKVELFLSFLNLQIKDEVMSEIN